MPKPYSFSFSYSRWSLWKKCPLAFKLQHIDKVDTGPTPKALLEGRKVHDDIANYLKGKADMPDRLAKNFSVLGSQLKDVKGLVVEEQMAFDDGLGRVSWFGNNARYRFIWDVGIKPDENGTVIAVDWKTGKPYGSYDEQAQMFCLPAIWTWENVQTVVGQWVYLDSGEVVSYHFDRAQLEQLTRVWTQNAAIMESDVAFQPTPSRDACKFCDHNPSRNPLGTCQFAVAS